MGCATVAPANRLDCFIDTTTVHGAKRKVLAAHRSQKEWLDLSRGWTRIRKRWSVLERPGCRADLSTPKAGGGICIWGFSANDDDPLREALKENYLCRES